MEKPLRNQGLFFILKLDQLFKANYRILQGNFYPTSFKKSQYNCCN
jgi:hypothetical protein